MSKEKMKSFLQVFLKLTDDMEGFFEPVALKLSPLIDFLSKINLYLVIITFAGLLFYMIFVRQHSVLRKLKKSKNYFLAAFLVLVYAVLTEAPIVLGLDFSLNLGLVILPLAAKIFGPVLAAPYGIILYGTSFVMHSGESFSLTNLFIAGISGILYGWILYQRRTRYLRCLWAKLAVNMICNVLLMPVSYSIASMTAEAMSQKIVSNLVLVPIQALAIFAAIIVYKKIKKILSEVSWGL